MMGTAAYTTTDTSPRCLRVGLTLISTSCPRAARKSMRRSTEKAPERLRINTETLGCLMPRIFPASALGETALLNETVNLQRQPCS